MDELRQRAEHFFSTLHGHDEEISEKVSVSAPSNFRHVYHVADTEVPPHALRPRVPHKADEHVPALFGAGYKPPESSLPLYNGSATISRPTSSQPLKRKEPKKPVEDERPLPALPMHTHPTAPLPEPSIPTPSASSTSVISSHDVNAPAAATVHSTHFGGDLPPKRPSRPSSPASGHSSPLPALPHPATASSNTLASHFTRTSYLFEDASFLCNDSVLAAVPVDKTGVVWLRIKEMNPHAVLFVDGFDPGDVIQGYLGDCWLLGALSVLATQPALCHQLLIADPATPGKYIVRVWSFGAWHEVAIDDRIPCKKKSRLPIYSRCHTEEEMWVPLIEKAFAKFYGSYDRLEGGYVHTALSALTGGLPGKIQFADVQADISSGKFWEYLTRNSTQCLMACVWETKGVKSERNGLMSDHAYGVLEIKTIQGHKLIRLRNPWGEKEWTGAWSDRAPQWTVELRALLRHETANDGTFWMSYDDFCKYFDRLYTCRVLPSNERKVISGEWRGETAGGCLNSPRWRNNPQYLLAVVHSGWTYVTLEQEEKHGRELTHVGFLVVKITDGKREHLWQLEESQLVAEVAHCDSLSVSIELYLEAGLYAVLPQTFDAGVERLFVLSAAGGMGLSLSSLAVSHAMVPGEWRKEKTAGGCRNNTTWTHNPTFILRGSGTVVLVIEQPKSDSFEALGFYVFPIPLGCDLADLNPICKSDFTRGVESSQHVLLNGNEPVMVLAALFEAGKEGNFTLHAYASSAVTLERFPA